MQLIVGIPLEVVHGSFRVGLIYGCGVLYGSMAASLFDPYVRLAGEFLFFKATSALALRSWPLKMVFVVVVQPFHDFRLREL